MSKKPLYNRLETLFAGIETEALPFPVLVQEDQKSWSWETNAQGLYTRCDETVFAYIGIPSKSFLAKSFKDFGLTADSSKIMKRTFSLGTFPIELEVEYSSSTKRSFVVRTNIFCDLNDDGIIIGYHGYNQVIGQTNKSEDSSSRLSGQDKDNQRPNLPITLRPLTQTEPVRKKPEQTISFFSKTLATPNISIPIKIGKAQAAIEISDPSRNRKWTEDERLLAQEVARQLSQAMENAKLYQEIRGALAALERRERYQSNIARSVALLSEKGTEALPQVLESLGKATGSGRVVFMEKQILETTYWKSVAAWTNPELTIQLVEMNNEPIACAFDHWELELAKKGWAYNTQWDAPSPERECLTMHKVGSALLLAVTCSQNHHGFIAFQDFGEGRNWENDEINILKVAANAITNAFNRSDLLSQLQTSLEETESLYKASHRLALAAELQEMVAAITQDLSSQTINRAVLILFEMDNQSKLSRIKVEANWHNGLGTPPPPVGTEYPPSVYYRLFLNATPKYINNIFDAEMEPALQEIFVQQSARSAAILPLWTNKRQTGVFLLLSDEEHEFSDQEIRTYPPLVDQLSTAIDNLRLFQQTEKALSETGMLYKISSGISQANDTPELVRLVAQHMLPKNAEAASIFLTVSDSNNEIVELELAGYTFANGHYQPAGINIPISALPFITGLKNDILVIPDIYKSDLDPISQKSLKQLDIFSGCFVPLFSTGKIIGVLVASSRKPAEYSTDEVRILQIASSGISVALEKHRLLRQAQRRALELQTAADIARDTTSTLSLEILLNRIVSLLAEQFGFYHVAIFLADDLSHFVTVKEATGDVGKLLKDQGFRLTIGSNTMIGSVALNGKLKVSNDTSIEPLFVPHPLLPDTKSEAALPLKIGARITGVLDIHSNKVNAFNPDDIGVIQILTDQIAVAIENAQSYELSQKALADMREVDRMKSQFLANMSHELRTPLNSIIGFSRVILKGIDGPINETQQQDLNAIYNSGQHLLILITDILDLSKIEAGKMELQFGDVNLSDLINSAMSTAIGLVKDKPIKLHYSIASDLPAVRADATRVRQVVINFMSNAAKFTDQGAITVEARLVTDSKHREVMVTVTDTGQGIAPADQSKLFQPFSQVDDSATRKTGGTGLGLSISRSLIELHGGRIGLLKSEVGKGSTFYFTLPLKDAEPEKTPDNGEDNTILAIDDDPQVINLYERYLKPQGFQVVSLTNPHEAVEMANKVKPAAITLDVMMPEMDGWQVLQELKKHPDTRQIPVIMCTILEDEEKGFNLGAAEYLVKPFVQEDLIHTINRIANNLEVKKILVVDDDQDDLRLVEKMLASNTRFQIILCEGGIKGWEGIQKENPDVVITDLFMPEMDGITLLGNIRSHEKYKNLPVIVLSGRDLTTEQFARLAEFGQKPLGKQHLSEQELTSTLKSLLRTVKNKGKSK